MSSSWDICKGWKHLFIMTDNKGPTAGGQAPPPNIWSVQEPTKGGGGEWALTSGDKRFTFPSPHSPPGRKDKANPVSGWICLLPVESPRKRPSGGGEGGDR